MRSNQSGFVYLTYVRLLHLLNLSIWHSFNVSSAQIYSRYKTAPSQQKHGLGTVHTVLEFLVSLMP